MPTPRGTSQMLLLGHSSPTLTLHQDLHDEDVGLPAQKTSANDKFTACPGARGFNQVFQGYKGVFIGQEQFSSLFPNMEYRNLNKK